MFGRCNDCKADTGKWFGDCLTCGLGFFRQADAGSCLDYCPTGSIASILTNECEGLDLLPISSVVFNKLGILYKGFPFGIYHLMAGASLDSPPINTITRGLFFDGFGGYVKIGGIVLNTNFQMHFWAYFFSFKGDLLVIDSETPDTAEAEQVCTYTCGESPDNASEADVGCNYNNEENKSTTSGNLQLNKWIDLNLIAKWSDVDATMDLTFHIGEFKVEFTINGNPFHHKQNSDITFGRNLDAFVLNFKIFNANLPKFDIDALRWDLDFDFDFSLPVCVIG